MLNVERDRKAYIRIYKTVCSTMDRVDPGEYDAGEDTGTAHAPKAASRACGMGSA
jgi:hypothetical protein